MKKALLFVLFMASLVFGQSDLYTSVVPAADSLGTPIVIGTGETVIGLFTHDSLTVLADSSIASSKTIKFYVYVGDTTGYYQDTTGISGWMLISAKDNGSSIYSATLVKNVFTPLDQIIMSAPIGVSEQSTKAARTYIKPYIVSGVGTPVSVKLRTITWK